MTAFRDRSGASSGPRRSKLELRMGPISFKLPADTAAGLVWPVGGRSATSYSAIVRVESGRVVSVCVLEQGCHGARWAQGRKRLASGAFSGWIFIERGPAGGCPDVREAAFFAGGPGSPGRRRASKARAMTGPPGAWACSGCQWQSLRLAAHSVAEDSGSDDSDHRRRAEPQAEVPGTGGLGNVQARLSQSAMLVSS